MPKTLQHFIDGTHVDGASGRFGDVYNPATGEVTGAVPFATRRRGRRAVQAAKAALPGLGGDAAAAARAGDVPLQAADRAPTSTSSPPSSPPSTARCSPTPGARCTRGLEVVEFACGIPHLLKGEYRGEVGTDIDSWSLRQPLGVCAGITPFNFPVMVPLWMFPVAIACGNTFVLKPSEQDPAAALRLAELFARGRPAGRRVQRRARRQGRGRRDPARTPTSPRSASSAPRRSPSTSITTARRTRQARAGAGRRQEPHGRDARRRPGPGDGRADRRRLRLGRRALHGDLGGGRGGRRGRRADRAAGAARARRSRSGPAPSPTSRWGRWSRAQHRDKVRGYVDLGVKEGAKLVVDGRGLKLQGYENGFFMGGCLFDDVTPEMRIYKEEIFGPGAVGGARARASTRRSGW